MLALASLARISTGGLGVDALRLRRLCPTQNSHRLGLASTDVSRGIAQLAGDTRDGLPSGGSADLKHLIGNCQSSSKAGRLYAKEIDEPNNAMTAPVLNYEILTPTARRHGF